jgi:hypothetical protein
MAVQCSKSVGVVNGGERRDAVCSGCPTKARRKIELSEKRLTLTAAAKVRT